ncbi:MAG: SDR family NAD(P)-dependent oxidoreductase [Pseudomonadota bacterium]
MDLEIAGKVALITGAGQGIGRGTAKVLAAEGAKVVVNDYYAQRAQAVAEEITRAGGQAVGIQADVTDRAGVKAMMAQAVETFGRIGILVNNAGVPVELREGKLALTVFAESEYELWKKVVDLNLYACLYCTHEVIRPMIEAREGKIISVISEAGRVGEPFQTVYSAAKAGILGFSKALAREVGRHAVNVNCVAVGGVAHEGTRGGLEPDADPETDPKLKKMLYNYPIGQGLGRIGVPADPAWAIAYLASPKACFITGQCLSVNGGFSMIS